MFPTGEAPEGRTYTLDKSNVRAPAVGFGGLRPLWALRTETTPYRI